MIINGNSREKLYSAAKKQDKLPKFYKYIEGFDERNQSQSFIFQNTVITTTMNDE